jgi:hypothetical protein
LVKQYLPNTRVDLGELEFLGMVPQSAMPEQTEPRK